MEKRKEGNPNGKVTPLHKLGGTTRPVRVQGVPGERSQLWDLVLGGPARSRELDSMIPKGPFQLEIFHEV